MARADLILSLVRSAVAGDQLALRTTVEALAADERGKRHGSFADRLTRALDGTGSLPGRPGAPRFIDHTTQSGTPSGIDFLLEVKARRRLSELTLSQDVLAGVEQLIEEHYRADVLRSYGLQPRHRILLAGPPGNGKTSLAEAIAEALSLQFFSIRYDALIGSYLGETNARLRSVFEYARTTPCVLLFDEFDALGKERGDAQETGEIKRVVSSLLLQIDALPSYVIAIAATNHEELLDRAVWRRFELRLELKAPTPKQAVHLVSEQLGFDVGSVDAVRKLDLLSFAEATDFALAVRRRVALSPPPTRVQDVVLAEAKLWASRLEAPSLGQRPQPSPAEARHSAARRQNARRKNSDSAPSSS